MKSKASIDQIIAFVLVTMVTFIWAFFLLLDYWSILKIKDRLDLVAQEAAHWLAKRPELRSDPDMEQNLSHYLQNILPSMHFHLYRRGDMLEGEINVTVSTLYKMHNRAILGDKNITAHFFTYSYYDQNGSYEITIY